MTQNNEREAFEKWYQSNFSTKVYFTRYSETSDYYDNDDIELSWEAWNARAQSPISQNEQPKQIPDGWKPIETVPKDGTQVIIKCSGGRVATAFYDDKQFFGEGWHVVVPFLGGFGSGTDTFIYFQEDMPTHWMPLPAQTTSLTSETNTEVGE